MGVGDEPAQVPVADVVPGQQDQVEGLGVGLALLVGHRAAGDVGLDADDRLDPLGRGGLVEGDRAVERAVIGQGEAVEALLRRRIDQVVDPPEPVEKAELGVDVEVREVVRGDGRQGRSMVPARVPRGPRWPRPPRTRLGHPTSLGGSVRSIELGLVLPMEEAWTDGSTPRWVEIRELALRAEAIGFDTVWIPDELLWRRADGSVHGWWESVAMTGAVAAATSRVKVGTWILSALHRNPAITAKAVETLDEISGGRFVFGLGSGHAGKQAHAFGLPEDHVIGRFEEALEIIVPLLRAGRADFEGTYHAARDLEQRPVGPRPGRIPIMIGAGGPKMLRLAARHADIWSWYVQERSELAEFAPRLAELEAACLEVGRDPASIGRSAGIIVEPTVVTGAAEALAIPLRGSAEEIADGLRAFRAGGFTQIEILLWPRTLAALEAMAPVLELLAAD